MSALDHFTCANCKRIRPIRFRHTDRMVCVNRQSCFRHGVFWLMRHKFANGAARRGSWMW